MDRSRSSAWPKKQSVDRCSFFFFQAEDGIRDYKVTGVQTCALPIFAEDVPALRAMKPGGKEHPIDKILHDGESVTLGGTALVAHLTPGHSRGCTTWTDRKSVV